MTYPEAIKYLESFINYEKIPVWPYKESLKLERIKDFLKVIDNPQESLKSIHVAGSKGKGSTCAFIAYILKEAGYKVGLYTSPHLSDFRERIRILGTKVHLAGGQACPPARWTWGHRSQDFEGMIPRQNLIRLVKSLRPAIEKFNGTSKYGPLSFFEVYTALAFAYFKEKQVDFVVLETGLGGRLDATNVVNALVSVITPISYEHVQKLGNTLSEIAAEKAGIIKNQKTIVVTAPQEKEAIKVIRQRCNKTNARLYEVRKINRLKIKLLGKHQLVNAGVAVAVIKALKSYQVNVSSEMIKKGLFKTSWPGRCEVVSKKPIIILDGAQNVASCRVLKEAIKDNFPVNPDRGKIILVLGISNDKDIPGICRELNDISGKIILTKADSPRAAEPKALARHFLNKEIYITNSVKEALDKARVLANKKDLILVTGSLFVVGEMRRLVI